MTETRTEFDPRRKRSIDAVVAFAALVHSQERGELATAAEARAELEALGVAVRFKRPKATIRKAVAR